jgi:hypothetical protein
MKRYLAKKFRTETPTDSRTGHKSTTSAIN